MVTLLLFFFTIFVVYFFYFFYNVRRIRKLPPGPLPFPLIGNFPQLAFLSLFCGGIVGALRALSKWYGPLFTVWIGPVPTVHIASMEKADELFVKRGSEFVDRWAPAIFNAVRHDKGIMATSGPQWSEQRRFALHTLRNFGLGRSIMEERIMAELDYRCDLLNKELSSNHNELELSPHQLFDLMVGSIINRMLFGERLDDENASGFYESKKQLDHLMNSLSLFDLLFLERDWVRRLPPFCWRWNRLKNPQLVVKGYLEEQVKRRLQEIESGDHVISDEPEDYVDAFVVKMKEEQKSEDPSTFSENALTINILDLWIAGQETTVTTLIFSFAYLLNNLEFVDEIRHELNAVTGNQRHLSLKDRPNTRIFNATITELQRLASIINVIFFRKTIAETKIDDYTLEKGTPIAAQVSLLMSDPQFFRESTKFDPHRYESDDKLEDHVIPFGLGKRSCPGESLARAELYLILGNMILRYQFSPVNGPPKTDQKNNFGILKRPILYKMRLSQL